MDHTERQTVLANWIRQAGSSVGDFAEGTDAARWIAAQFDAWWSNQVDDSLTDAEAAVNEAFRELERLGGWDVFGEAMHKLVHAKDALAELRECIGCATDT